MRDCGEPHHIAPLTPQSLRQWDRRGGRPIRRVVESKQRICWDTARITHRTRAEPRRVEPQALHDTRWEWARYDAPRCCRLGGSTTSLSATGARRFVILFSADDGSHLASFAPWSLVPVHEHAEAIMLDFVQPATPGRRRLDGRW
jgi:hypothetical protein